MTGHTADDQAETLLLRLLRGSGAEGLAAMQPGYHHPILGLRRADTEALCTSYAIEPIHDRSNDSPDHLRNRVRHELLPLAADIAGRDVVPILCRTAQHLRADDDELQVAADQLDPTDARALAAAPTPIARRALRNWLAIDGYPPDAAAIERVLAVAIGVNVACEIFGSRRVERSDQRLRIVRSER